MFPPLHITKNVFFDNHFKAFEKTGMSKPRLPPTKKRFPIILESKPCKINPCEAYYLIFYKKWLKTAPSPPHFVEETGDPITKTTESKGTPTMPSPPQGNEAFQKGFIDHHHPQEN